ncbi:MAG TPA: hypothetical protein VK137_08425, partial [Planctomycetaceae bacterium]|nr:hypothetical protein [Planctomycetaceae bacterium]
DPQEQYWSAFRLASDELDRFAESAGQFVSPLVAKLEKPASRITLSKRVLEPVVEKLPKLPLAGKETHLRRYNIAFVLLDKGEVLRLSVRGLVVSQQAADGQVTVIDPDGREVLSRTVPLGQTDEVELTAEVAGTHQITTSFGQNACEQRVSNARVVFFAGRHQRLKVHRVVRPLFFVVAEGQNPQVDVLTESPSDSVRVRLRDPRGAVVADEVVSGSQSVSAKGLAGVWSITLEPPAGRAFGGVQLGLAPPLSPYLADAPERLLRDKAIGR